MKINCDLSRSSRIITHNSTKSSKPHAISTIQRVITDNKQSILDPHSFIHLWIDYNNLNHDQISYSVFNILYELLNIDKYINDKFEYNAIIIIGYASNFLITQRIIHWLRRNRKDKKSNVELKREKAMCAMPEDMDLLMFTHTAPIINYAECGSQSKDFSKAKMKDYYRTGKNQQRIINSLCKYKIYYLSSDIEQFRIEQKQVFLSCLVPCEEIGGNSRKITTLYKTNERSRNYGSLFGAEVNSYTFYHDLKKGYIHPSIINSCDYAHIYSEDINTLINDIKYLSSINVGDGSYYDKVIINSRACVEMASDFIPPPIHCIDTPKGYYKYPCLILDYGPKNNLDEKIYEIINSFNKSGVILEHRNSFGFLHPSISKLTTSIRIWPGLLEPNVFVHCMKNVFCPLKMEDERVIYPIYPNNTMIYIALITILRYINNVYSNIAYNKKHLFLHNRIFSNIIKARCLIDYADSHICMTKDSYIQYYLESCQVIENLNEYTIQLLDNWDRNIDIELIKRYYKTNISNFNLSICGITNSGMDAGMLAQRMATSDLQYLSTEIPPCKNVEHKNIYFEFENLCQRGDSQAPIFMTDPAYNFPEQTKINDSNLYFDISNKQILILDITNMTSNDISSHIRMIDIYYTNVKTIYLFGSLSKHFQIGMDRFTLGIVLKYSKQYPTFVKVFCNTHNNLISYYNLMLRAQLPPKGIMKMECCYPFE